MGLADALTHARDEVRKGPRCSVDTLLETLPREEADALRAALDDPTFTSAAICRALKAEGYAFGFTTIARHRKGECKG